MNPSNELYGALQQMYEHFNKSLFDSRLPQVIFTAQRQKGTMGYFSPNRWVSKQGKTCHEIAINPAYVGKSALLEVLQTMVHEQCHLLQFVAGKPGRRGYHNKEWARMMQDVGLMPSSTGLPGGKTTGESMSDYPIVGGKFLQECDALVSGSSFDMPWVDRFAMGTSAAKPAESLVQEYDLPDSSAVKLATAVVEFFSAESFVVSDHPQENRSKAKYSCGDCGANVWGRPGLKLKCLSCDLELNEWEC